VRRSIRLAVAGVGAVALGLLALGALPSALGSGDPYYLAATPTDAAGATVNVTGLSERRYPYLTDALDSGRSDPYRTGPAGLKEAFTHSPFDEREGLIARNPAAIRDDGAVLVSRGDDRYLVEVRRA
jgi:hypothetical protein